MNVNIKPVATELSDALQQKIDQKTKPPGALGLLEPLALRIGLIQNTLTPVLNAPGIVVFAADHGAAAEGLSAYPSEVTAQMVLNFLAGGAAINVFARLHDLNLLVVDAGVNYDFPQTAGLIHAKIEHGTQNYLLEPAMSKERCLQALNSGAEIVKQLHGDGCNIIGFGEMGIGNTASAALLMSVFCNMPLERCVGTGTGLDAAAVQRKINLLKRARERAAVPNFSSNPIKVLSEFGGFEIAMMCGAILRAAELGMIILVDGFIATSALLVAREFNAHVVDYCVCSHCSSEKGHAAMLQFLNAQPLLDLQLRLGEGTGSALVYPLIQAAVGFLNDMASFESAGVSDKLDV